MRGWGGLGGPRGRVSSPTLWSASGLTCCVRPDTGTECAPVTGLGRGVPFVLAVLRNSGEAKLGEMPKEGRVTTPGGQRTFPHPSSPSALKAETSSGISRTVSRLSVGGELMTPGHCHFQHKSDDSSPPEAEMESLENGWQLDPPLLASLALGAGRPPVCVVPAQCGNQRHTGQNHQ